MRIPVVALDFDGVMNDDPTVWNGPYECGEPAEGLREFLQELYKTHLIVIHSLRSPLVLVDWLHRHDLFQYIHDIAEHKPPADVYVDDRAVQHKGDLAETLTAIKDFVPWWKKGA